MAIALREARFSTDCQNTPMLHNSWQHHKTQDKPQSTPSTHFTATNPTQHALSAGSLFSLRQHQHRLASSPSLPAPISLLEPTLNLTTAATTGTTPQAHTTRCAPPPLCPPSLVAACKAGQLLDIKRAIFTSGTMSCVNHVTEDGWTPLTIATAAGHFDAVFELIVSGADTSQCLRGSSTTAADIAHQKFTHTGRARFLRIRDLLLGRTPRSTDADYETLPVFVSHPTNVLMRNIREAIAHLANKQCRGRNCTHKVVVPYDYCGGRSTCVTMLNALRAKQSAHQMQQQQQHKQPNLTTNNAPFSPVVAATPPTSPSTASMSSPCCSPHYAPSSPLPSPPFPSPFASPIPTTESRGCKRPREEENTAFPTHALTTPKTTPVPSPARCLQVPRDVVDTQDEAVGNGAVPVTPLTKRPRLE